MIAKLTGKIDFLGNNFLILDVNRVGYKVFIPFNVFSDYKTGDDISLNTYTYVKEDILALYGFANYNDLSFFEQLISVSGVGPKAALNIISSAPIEKIKLSISKQDPAILYSVSGIGKKTAEKVVIELKNKIGVLADGNIFSNSSDSEDIISALENLGYAKSEILRALGQISEGEVEDKIKEALKILSKK